LDHKSPDIVEIRAGICDIFLIVALIASVPALAASLYRIAATGWLHIMAVQIFLFIVLVFLVIFRKRVPYPFRAAFIIAGSLILGLGGLWQSGLAGSAVVFLVAAPTLAAMLFGTRVGIFVLVLTIFSTGMVATITLVEHRSLPFDPAVYTVQPSSWINMIGGLSFVTAALMAALIMYNRHLIAALRDANRNEDELSRLVDEQTAELRAAQSTLVRQERLAVLGQLTGTVAHEIRNPLGAIANTFSVIKHKCLQGETDLRAALDRADRNIKRCDRIITELLDFARARGIQCEAVPLDSWLSDVLREQHIPNAIKVNLDLQTDNQLIQFDPDELRRAAINVIDNACQAMANGSLEGEPAAGELKIASRVTAQRVEIEVGDTGPGISSDILPQVFEPLFSTKQFGTGLGLSIARRIMEQHGGGLEIDSKEGRGTWVTLWLPRPPRSQEASQG